MQSVNQSSEGQDSACAQLPVSKLRVPVDELSTAAIHFGTLPTNERFERESATAENLSLVQFLARQLRARLPQHVDLEDLVSAGTVGLLNAVSRFDGDKKVQFRSYAQFRIRGAMMDSLRAIDWSPRTLRRQSRSLEEAKQVLAARGIPDTNDQQVADEMGIELVAYHKLVNDLNGLEFGRLEVERKDGGGEHLIDSVPGPVSEDPLLLFMQAELKESLIASIEILPEKERLILNLYYYEELTMKEISEILGVVSSRVSQLHASAILRLKRSLCQSNKAAPRKVPARCFQVPKLR